MTACVIVLASVGVAGFFAALRRRSLRRPGPPNGRMTRAARLVMDQYDDAVQIGGKPDYPQWAADVLSKEVK